MNYFLLCIILLFYGEAYSHGNLHREEAVARKKLIKSVSYKIKLEFSKTQNHFKGEVEIDFSLDKVSGDVFINAYAKKIFHLNVNGYQLDVSVKDDKVKIKSSLLKKKNRISISYLSHHDPLSLRYFTDPLDGARYFYTGLQPFLAHHVFPCFDQPDLKSTFALQVSAPKEWKILHNSPPINKEMKSEVTVTTFKKTLPMSPYLFFVGGGEFMEWSDVYQNIPLKIYARKSLKSFVDPENIFDITKKGLSFFIKTFAYPYPFDQYNQIFVPDYPFGGMENPGAITLNERHIFRATPTYTQTVKRQELIMHEMAHMWFGDLVTMQWWDDLWLNESFASYFSFLAIDRALGRKEVWTYAHANKIWAYKEDQYHSTTHPVVQNVPDTQTSEGIFDGITYAKGAASLKQLHFLVGEQAFIEGLQDYFKKFAFRNTTLNDFLHSIGKYSKVDVESWSKKWLKSRGIHRVSPAFECEEGKIKEFKIIQDKNLSGSYVPRKTFFESYKLDQGKLKKKELFELVYEDGINVFPDLRDRECPDFIFPNAKDQDYALFSFDPVSQKNLLTFLKSELDSLTRLMTWTMIDDAFKKGLSFKEYKSFLEVFLLTEKDPGNLSIVVGSGFFRHTNFKETYQNLLSKEERLELSSLLEDALMERIQKEDISLKRSLFDVYLFISRSVKAKTFLHDLFLGKSSLGLSLDQELRWKILTKLSFLAHPKALELIEREAKKDKSFDAQGLAFAAKFSFPNLEMKKLAWKTLTEPGKYAYTTIKKASESFQDSDHQKLMAPYEGLFLNHVTEFNWQKIWGYEDYFFHELFPRSTCSENFLNQSRRKLVSAKFLTPTAKKRWLQAQEDVSQCLEFKKRALRRGP